MTDPSDRTPSPDEAVSAHLDGAATPDERARVESDPELAARLDRFSEIADQVREVPAPPAGAVDDHVAAAMAAFGTAPEDERHGVVPGGDDVVVDRRHRGFWQRIPMSAVAAAAAVLVVVVGAIGLANAPSDDRTDTAAQDLDGTDAGGAASDDATTQSDEAQRETALTGPEAAELPERQAFADADVLAEYLRAQLQPAATADDGSEEARDGEEADAPQPSGGTTSAGSGSDGAAPEAGDAPVDPCDAVRLLQLEPSSVVTVVPAVLAERPVTAVVHIEYDEQRLVVVDDRSCAIVDERTL